tara:strand:- start:2585 stop:3256 length:672 start_codon:yes stop_codon:yes gene_type:complete
MNVNQALSDHMSDEDVNLILTEAIRLSDHIKLPNGKIDYDKVFSYYEGHMTQYYSKTEGERPHIACGKGCAFCCHLKVETLNGEMEYIMDHLSEYDRTDLYSKTRERLEAVHAKPEEKAHVSKPCVFLQEDNTCGIYAVRPLNCRGMVVEDRDECEKIFITNQDTGVAFHSTPKMILGAIAMAIQMVINDTKDVHKIFEQIDGPRALEELMEEGILNYLQNER